MTDVLTQNCEACSMIFCHNRFPCAFPHVWQALPSMAPLALSFLAQGLMGTTGPGQAPGRHLLGLSSTTPVGTSNSVSRHGPVAPRRLCHLQPRTTVSEGMFFCISGPFSS